MIPKNTVSELLVLLEQNFGDVADGFELYSQFRPAIQGMQGYLHQLHFLAMKAGSLSKCTDDVLLRDGVGEKLSKTAPVDDIMQLLRTEGSPYHQEKFRLKAQEYSC